MIQGKMYDQQNYNHLTYPEKQYYDMEEPFC